MDVTKILAAKYPAKAHAARVAAYIRAKTGVTDGVLYVEGQASGLLEDCDEPVPFRQRRAFMYLSGLDDVADSYLVHDMATARTTLFIPPVDPEEVIWSGLPLSADDALARCDVDAVLPATELNATLARLGAAAAKNTVFAIADRVAPHVSFLGFDATDFAALGEAVDECRVVKDEYEVALIRQANMISEAAHQAVMRNVRAAKNEYELEALFLGECYKKNAKFQAYPSIVASGRSAATLHYVHNNKEMPGKDLLLLDAGCEWKLYASDIVSLRRRSPWIRDPCASPSTD